MGGAQSNSTVIYHNPRCSTSRKTLQLLRDDGVEPTVVEYLRTPPKRGQLVDMIRDAGILIQRPFVVTPKGTRLARPVDAVRQIL
jgi:arsenate reductase